MLPHEQIGALCEQIREFLIENVSRTGGHLASNLGAVELTVALHRVFDTQKDRIIFDVGHQSYVHKILTGRRERFDTLRCFGGISGFPNPAESEHDAFVCGHSSNSVSAALGMARARRITGGNYDVACVIGDGALTGGMAYEALNDAGQSGEPLLVILNDNDMSIEKNVGALSDKLIKLRCKKRYLRAKELTKAGLSKIPFGNAVISSVRSVKSAVKRAMLPSTFFENIGFYYLGPADGHDEDTLERMINYARTLNKPVLLHIKTIKGKGYEFAEKNPEKFHSVGRFDVKTGQNIDAGKASFSDIFGQCLCIDAENNGKICAVTAAMTSGTGLVEFARRFPDRFFDVGIAEQHAVTMCAAMANQGAYPVCAVYSSFLQRAYDQLIHDTSVLSEPVLFAVDRAGIVGQDGQTHNGVFDVAFLSSVPGMNIYCPSSFAELKSIVGRTAGKINGPVAIRYPRGTEGCYKDDNFNEAVSVLKRGDSVTVVSYGIMINQAIAACDILESRGISCELIKLNRIFPVETDKIFESCKKTGKIAVIEDVAAEGCIGQKIAALMEEHGIATEYARLFNVGAGLLPHGKTEQIYKYCGIDAQSIADSVAGELNGN